VFKRGFKTWCENIAALQRKALALRPFDALDPFQFAKHLGVEVWMADKIPDFDSASRKILLEQDPDSWSAVTLSGGKKDLIILNPTQTGGRLVSNLMHELSHIVIGHSPAHIDVSEDGYLMLSTFDKAQEDEAIWLCGCLLLPREALLSIRRRDLPFHEVKKAYGASKDMFDYRMKVTGVLKQPRAFAK
jgi:hypothetical protein